MKILFYLEPHPIRERYESFGWIGKEICKMIQDTYVHSNFNKQQPIAEIKILTSRYYSQMTKEFPKISRNFIGLTREENNSLSYFYDEWNEDSIKTWTMLMKGEGEVSEFYKKILKRIKYEVFDFDVIVYWSTNGAVQSFTSEENLYSISMELGCTRKPFFESVYIDPLGVNGNAITRKLALTEVSRVYNDSTALNMPFYFHHGKEQESKYNAISSKYTDEIYKDIEKNILIPLQLDDDSNLILFSPYNSVLEFLQEVIPVLLDEGYRCFIKPHPGASSRNYTKVGHERCLDYCLGFSENVFWIDDVNNNVDYTSLINKMKAVITINSSLGFEAILLNKLVITMGNGAYSMDSLPSFEDFIQKRINHEEYKITIEKIINIMINNYLVPKAYAFNYDYFIEYILKAMRIYDQYISLDTAAFTNYFLTEKSNNQNYFLLLDADQSFLKLYKPSPPVNQSLNKDKLQERQIKPNAPVNGTNNKNQMQNKSIKVRKMKKLLNSPTAYFRDAIKNIFK